MASKFCETSTVVYKFNEVVELLKKYSTKLSTITEHFRDTFYEPFLFLESYVNSAKQLDVDFTDESAVSSLGQLVLSKTVASLPKYGADKKENLKLRQSIKHHFQDNSGLKSRIHNINTNNGTHLQNDVCDHFH